MKLTIRFSMPTFNCFNYLLGKHNVYQANVTRLEDKTTRYFNCLWVVID